MKKFLNKFFNENRLFCFACIISLFVILLAFIALTDLEANPIIVPDSPKQNKYLCLESTDCEYIENYLNEGYYSFCLDHQCFSNEIEPCEQMCEYEPKIF